MLTDVGIRSAIRAGGTKTLTDGGKRVLRRLTWCKRTGSGCYFDADDSTLRSICKAFVHDSGIEPFTTRDIRRTWKTLAGAAGINKSDRDRVQNHSNGDVSSKHYDRYDYLPEKRAALTAWEDWLFSRA